MATPVRTEIRVWFESMGYPMVELLLIGIGFGIRLAYTFCDNL